MLLWTLCFIFACLGLSSGLRALGLFSGRSHTSQDEPSLRMVLGRLQNLQESLEAGIVPEPEQWRSLSELPAPWGSLIEESLLTLRDQGGSVLPTLRRLKLFAEESLESIQRGKARTAQALGQAMVCAVLVPIFAAVLYVLLPGVSEQRWVWITASFLALALTAAGAAWMARIGASARWAGIPSPYRSWIITSQCAAERFLAVVRAGTPADLAWTNVCDWLAGESPELAQLWGNSVWNEGPASLPHRSLQLFFHLGTGLRRAAQSSLLEGRACTERVETAIRALRSELGSQVERELSLVGTRVLKPLFLCVAPSLLGLLAAGMFLGWSSVAQSSGLG